VLAPYSSLPELLRDFAKIYPVSSANSSITYLLVGENYAGYIPLTTSQTTLTIVISFLLFVAGLIFYSRFCWRKE
jgi:ABC-type polysaccharide/polyol phosphate export permease